MNRILRSLLAGAFGTACMTLIQPASLKGRGPDEHTMPGRMVARMLGLKLTTPEQVQALSWLVHWGYGTGFGLVRGALDSVGISGRAASALHLGAG